MKIKDILQNDKLSVEEKEKQIQEMNDKIITSRLDRESKKNENANANANANNIEIEERMKKIEQQNEQLLNNSLITKYGKDNLEKAKDYISKGLEDSDIDTLLKIKNDNAIITDKDKLSEIKNKDGDNKDSGNGDKLELSDDFTDNETKKFIEDNYK